MRGKTWFDRIFTPQARVNFAWFLLFTSIIAWPVTQFTVAATEPPFILGLSWFAVILTAWGILSTADVRANEEEKDKKSKKRKTHKK